MPAPAPPNAFTLTQISAGDPDLLLAWSHTGTDLDRFEVLFRKTNETTWTSYRIAPKADFGAGPNYSITGSSPPDTIWAVRAIASDGSVST